MRNTTAVSKNVPIVLELMNDRDAILTELLRSAAPRGLRIAARLVGPADAEDAVQEALARTMLEHHRLREPEAWFIRVLVNHCLAIQRRQRFKRLLLFGSWLKAEPDAETRSADEQLAAARQASGLRKEVAQLPPMQRTVVQLRFGEELSLLDIAEALGIGVETVKTHLSRALARLRKSTEEN